MACGEICFNSFYFWVSDEQIEILGWVLVCIKWLWGHLPRFRRLRVRKTIQRNVDSSTSTKGCWRVLKIEKKSSEKPCFDGLADIYWSKIPPCLFNPHTLYLIFSLIESCVIQVGHIISYLQYRRATRCPRSRVSWIGDYILYLTCPFFYSVTHNGLNVWDIHELEQLYKEKAWTVNSMHLPSHPWSHPITDPTRLDQTIEDRKQTVHQSACPLLLSKLPMLG